MIRDGSTHRLARLAAGALCLLALGPPAPASDLADWTHRPDAACGPSMKVHVPAGLPPGAPLVVALHGCGQTADDFAEDSGWKTMADRHGFAVIFPEEPRCANPWRCFNWFDEAHITRGHGEVKAIKEMVDAFRAEHDVDPARIYAAGFSAGGGMAVALLSVYPEVFAAGSISAGLPYKIADSPNDAWTCMLVGKDKDPADWAARVRGANPGYQGAYPPVVLFHGSADATVVIRNQEELVDQWTALRGGDQQPEESGTVAGHSRQVFHGADGKPAVTKLRFQGMGHAVPVNPGDGPGEGGRTGQFAKDVGLLGSYQSLVEWGLVTP